MALQHESDAEPTAFLVERYLPSTAAGGLPASVARLSRLCAATGASSSGVQYLHAAYLPTEDTCFCLFRAPDAAVVQAINDEANFPYDRITPAFLVSHGATAAATPTEIDPQRRTNRRPR